MGATGFEPVTSTVSMDTGGHVIDSSWFSLFGSGAFCMYSALIVPKLFPSIPCVDEGRSGPRKGIRELG